MNENTLPAEIWRTVSPCPDKYCNKSHVHGQTETGQDPAIVLELASGPRRKYPVPNARHSIAYKLTDT